MTVIPAFKLTSATTPVAGANVIPAVLPSSKAAGLEAFWWLASGSEVARKLDYSGQGNHLTKFGSPELVEGYTKVGGGNGFKSPLNEQLNMTLMCWLAIADAEIATPQQCYGIGNVNATQNYGTTHFIITQPSATPPAINHRGRYGRRSGNDPITYTTSLASPAATDANDPFNRPFADRTKLECFIIQMNATANTVTVWQPRVDTDPRQVVNLASVEGVSGRKLLTDESNPITMNVGLPDSVATSSFNTAVAVGAIYASAPSFADVLYPQYLATNAQLEAIFAGNARFSDL